MGGITVSARENYNSYTYDLQNNAIATSEAVNYADTIDGVTLGIGEMKDIADLFSDSYGNIYIVDKGNDRIVVIDKYGNFITKIDSFMNEEGNIDKFSKPQGIYVDEKKYLYIADTDNERIVVLDSNRKLIKKIVNPNVAVLGKDFIFKPSKIAVDSAGRIFVVSIGCISGILEFNANGEFNTCLGAADVKFDLVDYLWKLISTKEQIDRMEDAVPTEYNNITIDSEDFLYLTASNYNIYDYLSDTAVSLRKINPLGDNILKSYNNQMPFGDKKKLQSGSYNGGSVIVDTAVYKDGLFAILDSNRGKVFVYNSSSRLMFCFGGPGKYKDTFILPSSLIWNDDFFYVSDASKGNITIFKTTDYGKNLISAAILHDQCDYEAENLVWNEIMSKSSQSTDALYELGLSAYRNGDMKEAMRCFKSVNDRENYSKAYSVYRRDFINKNATYILLVVVFSATAIAFLVSFAMKKYKCKNHSKYIQSIWYAPKLMFRPLSGFWDLVREGNGTLSGGLTLMGMATIALALNAYASGFIFVGNNAILMNPLVILLKLFIPVILYSICNWCVTTLMDGEAGFKQILMSSSYALSPIIILLPIATLLSNFMILQEGELYNMIIVLAYVWVGILFVCSNKQIHDYSMSRSILVLIITLLVMAIIIFLFLLFLILMQQIFGFGTDLIVDIGRIINT